MIIHLIHFSLKRNYSHFFQNFFFSYFMSCRMTYLSNIFRLSPETVTLKISISSLDIHSSSTNAVHHNQGNIYFCITADTHFQKTEITIGFLFLPQQRFTFSQTFKFHFKYKNIKAAKADNQATRGLIFIKTFLNLLSKNLFLVVIKSNQFHLRYSSTEAATRGVIKKRCL